MARSINESQWRFSKEQAPPTSSFFYVDRHSNKVQRNRNLYRHRIYSSEKQDTMPDCEETVGTTVPPAQLTQDGHIKIKTSRLLQGNMQANSSIARCASSTHNRMAPKKSIGERESLKANTVQKQQFDVDIGRSAIIAGIK